MSGKRSTAVVLLLLLCSWSAVRGAERSVSCLLGSACLLPCPFDPGPEVVVHWLKPPDDGSSVHSFYHNTDQLGRQRLRYRGRTELFREQLLRGNASLRLTGVQLEDRGRYRCYTSTTSGNNEDSVTVNVRAPVSQVSVDQEGDRLLCRSEGIYPRPAVLWTPSIDPKNKVSGSEQSLYSVNSSVTLSDSENTYICNISTEHSWRSATYRRAGVSTSTGSRTEVPCAETTSSIKILVWIFNRNQTILNQTGSNTVYSPEWESRLEQVTGSKLVLKDPSRDQQGLYSCELTTDLSTYLTVTKVTVEEAAKPVNSTGIIVGVLAALVVVAVILGIVLWQCLKQKRGEKTETTDIRDTTTSEELLEKHDGASPQSSGTSESSAVE